MTHRGVVDRSPRGLVVVTGPEATSFLQGLVSQDLDAVADGASAPSLLLTPQGKLDVVFRAVRLSDEWWLDTDADYAPRLAASLTRFRIRVKANLEDRTAATGLASVVGATVDPGPLHALPTRWGAETGVDLLGPLAEVRAVLAELDPDLPRWSAEELEAFRIAAGVPRLGVDIDESTIAQEAFLDRAAVSFTKGCFLGQELVARIDTRGHVNRYLRGVRLAGLTVPPAGATIVVDERQRGAVTSAAAVPDEDRVVALAMVRREVEPPAAARVRWDDREVDAEIVELPGP